MISGSSATVSPITAGTGLNGTFVSGPAGIGTLTMGAGTTLYGDGTARTLANAVVFSGQPLFDANSNNAAAIVLNGAITFNGGNALSVNVVNPGQTATFQGPVSNIASLTSVTKNGAGNFGFNFTGYGTSAPITINGGGTFTIINDGTGNGLAETMVMGAITYDGALPAIAIGASGQTVLFNQPLNKVIAPSSLVAHLENGLTLTNNNQYGLLVSDNIALSSTLGTTGPIYTVSTASISTLTQGLTLSGVISGGTSTVVLTKAGAGAMVLSNATNTFGGAGAIIDVAAGILQVSANAALGNTANVVRLSANSGTQGLRLAGGTSYTLTGRTINLNAATVGVDVTAGTTATLDTAFTFSAATNALQKNDLGTLVISANNSSRTGATTIVAGVIQVEHANALGSGQISLASRAATRFREVRRSGSRAESPSRPLSIFPRAVATVGGLITPERFIRPAVIIP